MDSKYKNYLKSPKWKAIREKLFSIRGRKCERCENTTSLQVHHKTYKRLYNEKLSDLEILCLSCHELEHGRSFSIPVKTRNIKRKKSKKKRILSNKEKQKARIEKLTKYWIRNDSAKK